MTKEERAEAIQRYVGYLTPVIVFTSLFFLLFQEKQSILDILAESMATGTISAISLFLSVYCFGFFMPSLAILAGITVFALLCLYLPGFASLPFNWLYLQVALGFSCVILAASLVYSFQDITLEGFRSVVKGIAERYSEEVTRSLEGRTADFCARLEGKFNSLGSRAQALYGRLEETVVRKVGEAVRRADEGDDSNVGG